MEYRFFSLGFDIGLKTGVTLDRKVPFLPLQSSKYAMKALTAIIRAGSSTR